MSRGAGEQTLNAKADGLKAGLKFAKESDREIQRTAPWIRWAVGRPCLADVGNGGIDSHSPPNFGVPPGTLRDGGRPQIHSIQGVIDKPVNRGIPGVEAGRSPVVQKCQPR